MAFSPPNEPMVATCCRCTLSAGFASFLGGFNADANGQPRQWMFHGTSGAAALQVRQVMPQISAHPMCLSLLLKLLS